MALRQLAALQHARGWSGELRSAHLKYTYNFLRAVHENNLKTDTPRITYNRPGTLKSRYWFEFSAKLMCAQVHEFMFFI